MDLEHKNLGAHCDATSCKQRDFLPSTCDLCQHKFCLAHKSYMAHACSGQNSKDVTSIGCPICGLTVRLTMADNVNEVWEQHYLYSCSKEPAAMVSVKKCCMCNTTLGLSNTFTCKKCNKETCLTHRLSEDHECGGTREVKNKAFLDKLQLQNRNTNNAQKSSSSSSITSTANSTKSNNNRGGMDINNSSDMLNNKCPVCGSQFNDAVALVSHFESNHPSTNDHSRIPSSSSSSSFVAATSSNTNPSSLDREVCPYCSARFADVIALVSHVESTHPSTNHSSNSSGNKQNSSQWPFK